MATPGGIVIPLYEHHRRLFDSSPTAVIAAPPLSVFTTFEGERTGRAGTHPWLRSHGLGRHAVTEYGRVRRRTTLGLEPSISILPLVVKPSVGTNGMGVHVVRTLQVLSATILRATRVSRKT